MDEKVRKNWLVSFFIFYIGIYLIGGLNQFFGEFIDGFPRGLGVGLSAKLAARLFFIPLFYVVLGATTYYSAYRKKQIAWLVIFMIGLLLLAALSLKTFICYGRYDWSYVGCPTGHMLHQIFFVYLSGYYLFNCYKLYILNGGMSIRSIGVSIISFVKNWWSH